MLTPLLLALTVATPQAPACPDTLDVLRFVSRFLAKLPAAEHIQRGAFVLACRDRPVYAIGYGTTQSGAPVDVNRTLFRAASNSKLITATAAMQLAAAGRWKLGDEVNRYLPAAASLADGYGRQVTIADLLTHTAGFEDKFAGTITLQSDSISLANFFARNRPRRVRPPGTEVSYSNIGIALLGYAVQVASGGSFDAYVATHIFAPLGMTHSTFAQPPPADWMGDQASRPTRSARAIAFVPYPAASLVTTPGDMGRFIAAHLSGGALGGARILSAEMTNDMHASHWRPQPSVPAVAYGFFEGEMNGHRTLFHTGDSGDHSLVLLLPDDGVGFYFVYSGSDEQTVVREKLARAIVNRYFPGVTTPPPVFGGVQNVAALAGRYRGAAFSRSNYEKLKAMLYQMSVRAGSGGTLLVTPPGGATPITLRPRAPLVFAGDSGEIVAFRTGAGGVAQGFTVTGSIWDPQSFDRVSLLEDGRLHIAAFVAVAAALLVRLLYAPVAAVGRRLRREPRLASVPAERRWWRWSGIVTVLTILTPMVGLGVAFLSFRPGPVALPRAGIAVGVWLTLVSLAGLTLVPGAMVAWRRGYWTAARRVVFIAVAAAYLVAVPMLEYWRVLVV